MASLTEKVAHVRVVRKYLIHAIADCTVCGKYWENYLTVQKLASAHARESGHKVTADLGYTCTYLGNTLATQRKKAERRRK